MRCGEDKESTPPPTVESRDVERSREFERDYDETGLHYEGSFVERVTCISQSHRIRTPDWVCR